MRVPNNNQVCHDVVITGIGMVTPLGNDTATTWQRLLRGESGITALSASWGLEDYPARAVGLVTGEQALLERALPHKYHSRVDRFMQLAVIAGHEAMLSAGLSREFPADRGRFACSVGVGVGGIASTSDVVQAFAAGGPKRVNPFIIPKIIANLAPGWLSMQWDLQGSSLATVSACASGSDAIGLGMRAIRHGYADYVLAGGAEACALPLTIAGFGNMRALSTWSGDPAGASRPFDLQRSGFVLAEGAAMLVLERGDLARARGATIIAELAGYGATADAYHMTAMHPEGRGATNAINLALGDAGVDSRAIGYINAHGTATAMNDSLETMVIKNVFGAHALPATSGHLMVSSTKSMTGHMLGATGAAEAAFCALALRDGMVPPTINLTTPDPACDLDYVPGAARRVALDYAMSNSFGFGGNNTVLVLKRA